MRVSTHLRIAADLNGAKLYVLHSIKKLGLQTICLLSQLMLLREFLGSSHDLSLLWRCAVQGHKCG